MKRLHIAQLILTSLLLGAVAGLCWMNYRQQRLISALAENVLLQNELEILKQTRPCGQGNEPEEGADVRSLARR